MDNQEMRLSCGACGKVLTYAGGEPPCEALKDWLTLSHWKGSGAVDRHSFCSYDCLKQWLNDRVTEIPEAFLRSFGEGNSHKGREKE